jgi:hypothetical protein
MPSLSRGESSSASNPVLDIYTAVGNPPAVTDVAELQIRIFDISDPAKKGSPVQINPATPPDWETLDPTNDAPTGHRIGVGRYFAPWTAPLDESIGDHKIEWRFRKTVLSPWELLTEEFYVAQAPLPTDAMYCNVACLRDEGYDATEYPDARVEQAIRLSTRYIDRMTGRWFTPRLFSDPNFFKVDGDGSPVLKLEIPIISVNSIFIEEQGWLVAGEGTEVPLEEVRIYNRHLSGNTIPDDRENPKIAFIGSERRRGYRPARAFLRSPGYFPKGEQNVWIAGQFGYTDFDGSASGKTPDLIRQVCCELAAREVEQLATCQKMSARNKHRVVQQKFSKASTKLQDDFLRGRFTGNPAIDNILMSFRRTMRVSRV